MMKTALYLQFFDKVNSPALSAYRSIAIAVHQGNRLHLEHTND